LICFEVGFRNVANFNRRFAQYKQMTPSEYRQQARQRYI
jgi:AraC-like DNA-binding protein